MKRTFTDTGGEIGNFWTIETEGTYFIASFGESGASGQRTVRTFASDAECRKEIDRLIAEKIGEGYIEQAGDGATRRRRKPIVAGPEHATEVEALVKTVADGDYVRSAAIVKDLLQKEDLTGHYRQRVQAHGIAVGTILNDAELVDLSTKDIREPITSDTLAFNLACLAAVRGDKPAVLKYMRRALRVGKEPKHFLDDKDFAECRDDPEFLAVLEGRIPAEFIATRFYKIKDDAPYLNGGPVLYDMQGGVPYTKKLQLPIHLTTEDFGTETEMPHVLTDAGRYIFSLQFLNALREIGVDRFQTFPVVITDEPSGKVWRNYVLVNPLGIDFVMDEATDESDEFDVELVLDDRKIDNDAKFLVVQNSGLGGDFLILSLEARRELKQYAPLRERGWCFHSITVPVADHWILPKPEELTAEEWCEKCEQYLDRKLCARAIECAQNAVARDDKNHLSWYWLGKAHSGDMKLRKPEGEEESALRKKIIEFYEKSVELNPNYAPAWLALEIKSDECLLKALEVDGRFDDAYEEFFDHNRPYDGDGPELARKWTENAPENPRAWYCYAESMNGDEYREQRIAAYEKALEIKRLPNILWALGREYCDADPEKALFYFSQLTQQDTVDFSYFGWNMFGDFMWKNAENAIRCATPLVKEELVDVFSDKPKFWNIETEGASYAILSGELGTEGESSSAKYSCNDESLRPGLVESCQEDAYKKYAKKRAKNYLPLSFFNLRPDLKYEQSPEAKALEDRYSELLGKIEALPKSDLKKLPKEIADPRAVFDALDDKKLIKQIRRSLLSAVLALKGHDFAPQGMIFEWYYDGDNNYDYALGDFYGVCEFKDGRPEFGGGCREDAGEFYVGGIMGALYESLNKLNRSGFSDPSLIADLFDAKLFMLAERAYRKAEKFVDMPLFFMGKIDAEPIFIAAPRGKTE
ncbi:MAG: WGR domain-containing protein [Candidatus Methanoplasma sp.]|jgi:predicted DNA-binding WGR domain protein/tetratricopeptide (TPR) repeat protein|nr:WGR domain-containing protein [Candidatus Methanoplasma sp.]